MPSGGIVCPLCLEATATLLIDKKGRPYLKCSCSTTFVRTRQGLRAVGLYSSTARHLLRALSAHDVGASEQAGAAVVARAREQGGAVGFGAW